MEYKHKFKVGDTIIRMMGEFNSMVFGDKDIIISVGPGYKEIGLKIFSFGHDATYFELVKKEKLYSIY